MVHELLGSAFELLEHPSDAIPLSMCHVLKSEMCVEQCGFQPRSTIKEEETVYNIVFLLKFAHEQVRQHSCSFWKQPDVQEIVRAGIDSSELEKRWPFTRITVSLIMT